jgi:putative glutamine amidotransferase
MAKPLIIGISARIHHPIGPVRDLGGVYLKTLHYLEQSVAHWVLAKDVLAVMIPAIESEGLIQRSEMSLASYAEHLDGLVLQGGADVAPESYGETPLTPEWSGDRGCQLINVALGGTLFQDIPTQVTQAISHRDADLYERALHGVTLIQGTRLSKMYPDVRQAKINSIHHQAVKDLGSDLVVEALGVPDGIVEAIRWRGPSYVFGMQWHPEFLALKTLDQTQLDGVPILTDFLDNARACRDAS